MRWSKIALLGVALVVGTGCPGTNNDNKVRIAQARLQVLTGAVQSYFVAKGDYPDNLPALLDNSEGIPDYVDMSDLVDPWGRPYHYEPQTRHPTKGTPLIYSDGPTPGDPSQRLRNWTLAGEAPASPPQPARLDPDPWFAQAVAEGFLGHTVRGKTRDALAMGTPAFQQQWGGEPAHGVNPSRDEEVQAESYPKYSSWQFGFSTLSAGGDGAVFKGKLFTLQGEQGRFILRLVKEQTTGEWKVDGFEVR
jgi:hypothetical protein